MYVFLRDGIIGPLLRIVFRVSVIGAEIVPKGGALICASNHEAVIDSFLIPAFIRRRFTFMAKHDYFNGRGFVGRLKKRFFSVAAIPVDRSSREDGQRALEALYKVLRDGGTVGIHPEGTRTPGGKVYRGKGGVIEMAWATGAPVLPIVLLGTSHANPPGRRIPRLNARITMVIGEPMYFKRPIIDAKPIVAATRRIQTQQLMKEIARLGMMSYEDQDAAQVKAALAAGEL